MIEAKSQASKLNEVSSINEQISGVARQLKKEIDDKDNEISTLRSTLTEQRTEIESLTIQTTTMDVLNQALNEELRNSQEMIDSIQSIRDIRETEDRNSREGISFSMLSHEEQESLRSELGKYKYKIDVEGSVYFSILVASCIIWSAALDSSHVLLSYSITSPAYHITTILIHLLFFKIHLLINIHLY